MSPVGRITCSLKTPPVWFISHGPGVADTLTVCGRITSHSLKRRGRLSMQLGRRKPYSASVIFRLWSPRAIAPICGTEIGRAHVLTPVTNAHLVCRLLLEKK